MKAQTTKRKNDLGKNVTLVLAGLKTMDATHGVDFEELNYGLWDRIMLKINTADFQFLL